MRILFATAQPFPPQMIGGLQRDISELCIRLNAREHECAVLCGLTGDGMMGLWGRIYMKLTGKKATPDRALGHQAWRGWFVEEGMSEVVNRFNPDVIVVGARQPVRVANAARKTAVPTALFLQDVEFNDHGDDFKTLGEIQCVANSNFTAQKYHATFGINPFVIYPVVDPKKYKTEPVGRYILFINPHPFKGLEIALGVARRCPDIPFLFLESWPIRREQKRKLELELSTLPNVTFHKAVQDMRKIYAGAKIILAPSQWEEAFGRIASEAQISGIPVLASRRGGLTESVGPGGVLVDPDSPLDVWAEQARKMWNDKEFYGGLACAALVHSQRIEMNPDYQIDQWEKFLKEFARKNET